MKKLIPINSSPNLACYGYESYNDSIASNIARNNTIVEIDNLNIGILEKETENNSFCFKTANIGFRCENGLIKFAAMNNGSKMKCILYKRVLGDTVLSFRVLRQEYTSPWAYVSALVSDSDPELENNNADDSGFPYMFGYFKKTGLGVIAGSTYSSLNAMFNDNDFYWLRMEVRQGQVFSYYSENGQNWINACNNAVNIGSEYYIGILLDMGEYCYYNWLYSNHIQIFCNNNLSESTVPIEYFFPNDPTGMTKFNPFIQEYNIPYSLIEAYDIRIDQLIKYCINQNMYLDLPLNEKYIKNRWAYGKNNYIHYNMVFGYDDVHNTASILGYNEQSKVSTSTVDYDSLQTAYYNSNEQDVIFRKLEMGYTAEILNVTLIYNLVEDYFNSRDSSWRYPGMCIKRDNCSFGLSVYDCITNSEQNFASFLGDKRIAYFLMEHKKIMKDRVTFLIERNIISDEFASTLMEKSKKLYDIATTILLLVMKYNITKSESIKDRLKKHLVTAKSLDMDLCDNILKSINSLHMD